MKFRKILIWTHFVALTFAIVNSLLKSFTTYSLEGNIEFGIELYTAISGLVLFFFYFKPFKKVTFYFSIYPVLTFLLIIGLIFRGFLGALIFSLVLYPIIPDDKQYEQNGIIVSTPFQGSMAGCCYYQIKERKLLFFEKDCGIFETYGSINFETLKIESTEDEIELVYHIDSDSIIYKKKIER